MGFVASFTVSVTVSILTRRLSAFKEQKEKDSKHLRFSDLEIEWQKTMSIDNPLNTYLTHYKEQLAKIGVTGKHVTTHHMAKIFRRAKFISCACAAVSFLVFIVAIPAIALSQTVLTEEQLEAWVSVCQYWCMTATVLVVLIPPLQEGWQIWRQWKTNKESKPVAHSTVSARWTTV